MRSNVRHTSAHSASWVEIGGAPGSVASALSFAKLPGDMRRRVGLSEDGAVNGCGGGSFNGSVVVGVLAGNLYAGCQK
ncbi:unnamed protein product [Sphagnum balticum]